MRTLEFRRAARIASTLALMLASTGGPPPAAAAGPAASAPPSLTPPSAELTPVEAAAPYGRVLAISGDTAAVTGTIAGKAVVFVFLRAAGTWTEQARILDPAAPDPASVFGSALALSGDTLAVGAGAENAPVSSVYLFVRTAGAWGLEAHLQPPRAAALGFGASLALAGDALVIGVPGAVDASATGAAYVYARNGATWSRQAILTAETPAPGDRFGRAVGVAHQHLIVGGSGFAEIFDLAGAAWRRAAVLHGSGAGAGFGTSVAASLETVAIGDPVDQQVSLFIHTSAGWFHQADLIPPDPRAAGFGSALSLSQDTLVVGAPGTSRRRAPGSGAAYAFIRTHHRWLLGGAFGLAAPAPGEGFGGAVAVSLATALVGPSGGNPMSASAWLLDGLDKP